MHNKLVHSKIKLCLGMFLCTVAILVTPMATFTSYAADGSEIEVCADYKHWVYKIMDGKMYKALLNNSTGLYETDWIYVCDWPPEE